MLWTVALGWQKAGNEMTAVLLTVGKVLLTVLLVAIGVILAALMVILFCPIRYQLQGKKREEAIAARGEVRWFWGALRIIVLYREETMVMEVFLFGRPLLHPKRKAKPSSQKSQHLPQKEPPTPSPKPSQSQMDKEKPSAQPKTERPRMVRSERPGTRTAPLPKKLPPTSSKQETMPKIRRIPTGEIGEKKTVSSSASQTTVKKAPPFEEEQAPNRGQKKEQDVKKKPLFFQVLEKLCWEEKKEVFFAGCTFIKGVLKEVFPEECALRAILGTGEPESTGQILAALAIGKGLFFRDWEVTGEFDEKRLDGTLRIAGRIRLIRLGWEALRLVMHRPVRKLIGELWKGRGERI